MPGAKTRMPTTNDEGRGSSWSETQDPDDEVGNQTTAVIKCEL
jgi:hypothetical protein